MCHSGLSFRSVYLRMKIEKAVRYAQANIEGLMVGEWMRRATEMFVEWAEGMVVGYEPELRAARAARHVATDVAEYVVVSWRQQLRIDLGLAGPCSLVPRKIYLHCYTLAVPDSSPYFAAESAAAGVQALDKCDLLRQRTLHQQRQSGTWSAGQTSSVQIFLGTEWRARRLIRRHYFHYYYQLLFSFKCKNASALMEC